MNLSTFICASASHIPPLHRTTDTSGVGTQNFAIEGQNLNYSITTRHGKLVPILKDCSLRIPSGQLWMLLGPNGCGKSTLLKVLAGLLNPTHGTAYVRRPKSFVFQNPDHQVVMPTVEADVAFGLGKFNLTQDEVRSRVAKALDAVGMSDYLQRPVQTLSGGQKQRVAIAGALAEACKVLLLDELTTFLDENDQVGVIKAVKSSLGGSGDVTALWVTHRLEELEYADGAVYMEDGKVVMDSDASSVLGTKVTLDLSKDTINGKKNLTSKFFRHRTEWVQNPKALSRWCSFALNGGSSIGESIGFGNFEGVPGWIEYVNFGNQNPPKAKIYR
ncbi:hypothetical protein NE237_019042 [Protea cynaroides]|uniref:ABC transporter domain-containing protein n=1 Tax=Protea cynaroides TaxID=273540 RepID=A0A9Q0KAZ4_9MAGN|nr:hypothetical protein NE237_019042 [Protea cynaroides]